MFSRTNIITQSVLLLAFTSQRQNEQYARIGLYTWHVTVYVLNICNKKVTNSTMTKVGIVLRMSTSGLDTCW